MSELAGSSNSLRQREFGAGTSIEAIPRAEVAILGRGRGEAEAASRAGCGDAPGSKRVSVDCHVPFSEIAGFKAAVVQQFGNDLGIVGDRRGNAVAVVGVLVGDGDDVACDDVQCAIVRGVPGAGRDRSVEDSWENLRQDDRFAVTPLDTIGTEIDPSPRMSNSRKRIITVSPTS